MFRMVARERIEMPCQPSGKGAHRHSSLRGRDGAHRGARPQGQKPGGATHWIAPRSGTFRFFTLYPLPPILDILPNTPMALLSPPHNGFLSHERARQGQSGSGVSSSSSSSRVVFIPPSSTAVGSAVAAPLPRRSKRLHHLRLAAATAVREKSAAEEGWWVTVVESDGAFKSISKTLDVNGAPLEAGGVRRVAGRLLEMRRRRAGGHPTAHRPTLPSQLILSIASTFAGLLDAFRLGANAIPDSARSLHASASCHAHRARDSKKG